VFPGLQGGPLMHVIAAKAVAFGEALKPEFKTYAQPSSPTPRRWPSDADRARLDIVSGGTDNHLMLVDLRRRRLTGKAAEAGARPRRHHLQQERHPLRPGEADVTSGVRLGTPAGTTRGFGVAEFRRSAI
jgi:glycine hydroxymethyltransferase